MNRIKLVSAILFVNLLTGATVASAQNSDEYHSKAQVSFFPPLSTNGSKAGLYTNNFSFNILVGVSKNERAFAIASLTNIIRNDATGIQLAGLVNTVGGDGRAAQFAGLANVVRGSHTGAQFAGLTNTVRGDHSGAQFAGLVNTADDLEGYQDAGLVNIAGDVKGVQSAGLANIAGDVKGAQIGGLFNVAKKVRGVQIAGLFNVAEESDYPVGLVNIIKEGEMGVAVGYNEIGTTSLTFRSGGRVLYGILGLGYNHQAPKKKEASLVGGIGAHINIMPWLRINNEITTESIGMFSKEGDTFKAGYALLPAFRPVRNIEIFGGPSINYMHSANENMFDMFPKNSFWDESGTRNNGDKKLQQAFVGWQVGVQYIF